MPDIIFHIGQSRAASTALQRDLFRSIGAIGSLSRISKFHELRDAFLTKSPDIWKESEGIRLANELLKYQNNGTILYSEDALSNSLIFQNLDHPYVLNYPQNLISHLENFKKYAWDKRGRVSVIFIIRNQSDWLASRYTKSMNDAFRLHKISKHLTFDYQNDFEKRIENIISDSGYLSNGLRYDLIIESLSDILGKENILPLIFEEISEPIFLKKFIDFTGFKEIDVNHFQKRKLNRYTRTSDSQSSSWMIRANHFRIRSKYQFINYLFNGIGKRIEPYFNFATLNKSIHLDKKLRIKIKNYYKESNIRLSKLCGIDLSKYNY